MESMALSITTCCFRMALHLWKKKKKKRKKKKKKEKNNISVGNRWDFKRNGDGYTILAWRCHSRLGSKPSCFWVVNEWAGKQTPFLGSPLAHNDTRESFPPFLSSGIKSKELTNAAFRGKDKSQWKHTLSGNTNINPSLSTHHRFFQLIRCLTFR